ncbi:DUF6197 family protein [Streptomyces zaomyceticus]|uniref:DUF6197 family protein n=1 Tax=Streptomyces zaomyceticus TaxID=68286 RepID=UPI0037A4E0C4
MTTSTSSATVFTDEVLARAAELAQDAYQPVWTGPSGEEATGELVACHLEATIALLDKDGWIRNHHFFAPRTVSTQPPAIETMSTQAMVREVLLAVREENSTSQRTLSVALDHVMWGEEGDTDTREGAFTVLNLVIRAHTGHDQARAMAWAERLHRTHADVTALLAAGARFARTYGPGAAVGPTRVV